MGSIVYKKFLSAVITHNFYLSEKSADFTIVPTPFTQQKLRNEKMVFRAQATGFKVFYRSVSRLDENPFTPVADGVYSFGLRLKNPQEFLNITNLKEGSLKYTSGNIIYFRNTNPATNTIPAHEILNRLLPSKFNYDFALSPVPGSGVDVRLRVKDSAGTTVYTSADPLVGDENGNYRDFVDLSQLNPGKYSIVPVKATVEQTAQTEKVYIDSGIAGKDIFGVIDIEFDSGSISFVGFTELGSFLPAFIRRVSQWKYYVVNKKTTVSYPTLSINDASGADAVYGSYTFSGPTPENPVNGFETKSFISPIGSPIPFYERPKLKLELELTSGDNVIDDLPNPTRQSSAGEIPASPTDPDITPIIVFI